MRPVRGSSSHSAIRPITIRYRSVFALIFAVSLAVILALISASRRFADMPPDAVAQAAEGIAAQHLVGAGPRQLDLEMIDDAAGPRRHHDHLVGEIDRFGEAVRDEDDGLACRRPDA